MEMKHGFKKTEAGLFPVEWEVAPMGAVATVSAGGTPSRSKPQYWGGRIPWITTSEVNQCTIHSAQEFITKEGLNNSAAKLLPVGTLLMALYGQGKTRGKVAALAIEAATNQACAAISLTKTVSPAFVLHFLIGQYGAIRKLSNTGNQENLNSAIVRSILIPLPSKLEQEAIAEALSDADALIESLEQLLAKKRHIKQGTMQELLTGKKRLPGFYEKWNLKNLGDIAETYSGGTPSTSIPEYYEGDIPWITSGDLNQGYIWKVSGSISKSGLENSAAKMVKANTLLIALYGATAGVTAISMIDAAINQAILAIVPKVDDTDFLYFKLSYAKEWLISTYTQGGQPNLSGEIVKSIQLTLPCRQEQTAIATILSDMDTELAALEAKLDKARQIKQGMMQELLTGRIRLV